jgi:FkbM family methyltransferase
LLRQFKSRMRWFLRLNLFPIRFLTPGELFWKRGGNSQIYPDGTLVAHRVIDFGGYMGEYAEEVLKTGNPQVFIFEPVKDFYDIIKNKFSGQTHVEVVNYAIGTSSRKEKIGLSGAASGINIVAEKMVEIEFKTPDCYPHVFGNETDICKINIEGGEYELIRAMHASSVIQNINTLFIQFHEHPTESMLETRKILEETHERIWSYDFVWERWNRKMII